MLTSSEFLHSPLKFAIFQASGRYISLTNFRSIFKIWY